MIGNIFNTLLSTTTTMAATATKKQFLDSPYAKFASIARNLDREVEAYVETGASDQVLTQLGAFQSQTNRDLRIATSNFSILASDCGGNPEKIARLAKVRKAAQVTTAASDVEALFEMIRQSRSYGNANAQTLVSDVVAAARLLRASEVEAIFHILPRARYGYAINLPGLDEFQKELDPAHLAVALELCDAKERFNVLTRWQNSPCFKAAGFLPYLFQLLGGSSSTVRDIVRKIAATHPPESVEPLAIKGLGAGKASERESCALVLGDLGTESALEALKAHLANEKAQAVVGAIEAFLATKDSVAEAEVSVEGGYLDATAQWSNFRFSRTWTMTVARPWARTCSRSFLRSKRKPSRKRWRNTSGRSSSTRRMAIPRPRCRNDMSLRKRPSRR